ncbi:nuclear transport factor 2 family protein [Chloroflexota bacterium]
MKADAKTEAEVMSVLDKMRECYEKRDLNGLLALFATDADLVAIGSGADEKCIGPTQLKAQLERDFTQSESLTINYEWLSISAAGSVAWMAADCVFNARIGGEEMILRGRLTGVLEKREDRWFFMQQHLSMPSVEQQEGQSFPA